jgi:hypothetical protein
MASIITVEDVRNAGLSEASLSDEAVQAGIDTWQPVVERYCRQWFDPRAGDFYLDGNDSDTLFLPFPIISLSALYANGSAEPIESTYYRVYSGKSAPNDDRRNPRVAFNSASGYNGDIFTASYGSTRFRRGRQNQRLVGVFGFVEEDGSTPAPIKHALTKLVIQKLTQPMYVDPNGTTPPPAPPPTYSSGQITDEWTDWHRIKRESHNQALPKRADGMSDTIEDPEIRGILKMYRAPLAMGSPAGFSWKQ